MAVGRGGHHARGWGTAPLPAGAERTNRALISCSLESGDLKPGVPRNEPYSPESREVSVYEEAITRIR